MVVGTHSCRRGVAGCRVCRATQPPEAVMRARAMPHEGLGGCMGGEPALIGVYHRQGGLAGRLSHLSASPLCGWLSCEPCHAAPVALTHTLARNGAWGLFPRAVVGSGQARGCTNANQHTKTQARGIIYQNLITAPEASATAASTSLLCLFWPAGKAAKETQNK